MIGLEYLLKIYDIQHMELAEKLGIKKQNITMWIKGKQKIPEKHMPIMQEIFGVHESQISCEISEMGKMIMATAKWDRDRKIQTVNVLPCLDRKLNEVSDVDFAKDVKSGFEEMSIVEKSLRQRILLNQLSLLSETNDYDVITLLSESLENKEFEKIFSKVLIGVFHYMDIIPSELFIDEKLARFERDLFKAISKL